MKKFYYLFFLVCFGFAFSQSLNWNTNYIALSNITKNSINYHNKSDNAIKLKFFSNYNQINELLIPAKSYRTFKANVKEFDRNYIDNIKIELHYDLECYQKDVQRLNNIARNRYNKAKRARNIGNFFGVVSGGLEAIGWEKLAKISGRISSAISGYLTAKREGLAQAGVDYIIGEIEGKAIDNAFEKNWQRGSVKALRSLYDWYNESSDIKIDNSDLEALAMEFTQYIRSYSISTYSINYSRDIRPVVDYDNDGITNSYDRCPDEYGPVRYGKEKEFSGCPKDGIRRIKKEIRISKRKERREKIKTIFIDLNYSYSAMGMVDGSAYSKNLTHSSFFPTITIPFIRHKYGDNTFGAFGVGASISHGKTQIENLNSGSGTLFSKDIATADASYMFLFKLSDSYFMLQPRAGVIAYSSLTEQVKDDLFIIEGEDEIYKEKLLYYDLNLKMYIHDVNNVSFQLGARYLNNPNIIVNPKYENIDLSIGDNKFKYPETSLYFYGGINLSF